MKKVFEENMEIVRLTCELEHVRNTNKVLIKTALRLSDENKKLKEGNFDPLEKPVRAVYELLNDWIEEPYRDGEETDKLRFSREVVLLVKKELEG